MTIRATVVGAGGLGGPLALALGAAGIELAIVDPDAVELSNLHRQIQFTALDIGKPKASVLAGAVVARGGTAKGYQVAVDRRGRRRHLERQRHHRRRQRRSRDEVRGRRLGGRAPAART